MKAVGLLKAFDNGADDAKLLAEYLNDEAIDESLRISVLNYLKNGHHFTGLMEWWVDFEDYGKLYSEGEGFVSDEDEVTDDARIIGSSAYYTDGKWIWAEYLPYYLDKYPNFAIDNQFVEDLKNRNYQMPDVSEEQRKAALNYFYTHIFKGLHCEAEG